MSLSSGIIDMKGLGGKARSRGLHWVSEDVRVRLAFLPSFSRNHPHELGR